MTDALERLRAALADALGDDRLAQVDPDAPLLQGGVVSSLELVLLLAALRERYGVEVPAARAAQSLSTLNAILALTSGLNATPASTPAVVRPGFDTWRRFARRPGRALLGILLALLLLDQGWRLAVETALWPGYLTFREQGQRLYPLSGHLAQDDFRVAAEVHEIRTAPDPDAGWIAVLGDSGTIGSYLQAEEAFPAQAQRRLEALGLEARVANLAFYGRLLVKDLMLLELFHDEPLRAVVFTLGDDHLSRTLTQLWQRDYPHVSHNLPLLERAVQRLPAADQRPFAPALAMLRAADRRRGGSLRRLGYRYTGLLRYRHYLRYLLLDRALPRSVGTELSLAHVVRDQRLSHAGPRAVRGGVPQSDLDPDQVEILRGALRRLRARGVPVVLLLEPAGPREWRPAPSPGLQDTRAIYAQLAQESGATLLDLRWALTADAFTDNLAHYTAAGSALLGERLGDHLAEVLR